MDNDAQYGRANGYIVVLQSAIILQMKVYTLKYYMYFQFIENLDEPKRFSFFYLYDAPTFSFSPVVYNVSVVIPVAPSIRHFWTRMAVLLRVSLMVLYPTIG